MCAEGTERKCADFFAVVFVLVRWRFVMNKRRGNLTKICRFLVVEKHKNQNACKNIKILV